MALASKFSGLRVESLVVGLGLVALGVLWTLANLDRVDLLRTLRTWWPLSLVVWGALELVNTALVRSAQPTRTGDVDLGAGEPGTPSGIERGGLE